MKNREGHTDDTKFFIGTEVEHSPAYGQKTLFVVGRQNTKEVLARAINNNCPHIYLGANQSFSIDTEEETVISEVFENEERDYHDVMMDPAMTGDFFEE